MMLAQFVSHSLLAQEWEEKAAEDKKRADAEMEKWMNEGGAEQIKAAKKEARAAKRAEKGGGGGGKSSKKSKSNPTKEPTGGSGSGFKSKEFIVDSDSGKLGRMEILSPRASVFEYSSYRLEQKICPPTDFFTRVF